VNKGGHQRVQDADRRQANAHDIDRDRTGKVLRDNPTSAMGDPKRFDETEEVIAEKHDVRALSRDIGAGTHRDADVGFDERRSVVDAVANHGDRATLHLR
jgi:hypothetical protein